MDFRNEYRIVPSEYRGAPYALEYREWWYLRRWEHLGIFAKEEDARARAIEHARNSEGLDIKHLGRLP